MKIAVHNELRREEEAVPWRDRIAAIRHGIVARPLTGEQADKAFFDELSGDL